MILRFVHIIGYLFVFAANIGASFAKYFNCSCTKDSIAEMENNDFTYFEKAGDIERITVRNHTMATTINITDKTTIVARNNKQHLQLKYNSSDTVDVFTANTTVTFNSKLQERMTVDVNKGVFALETTVGHITVDIKNVRGSMMVNAITTKSEFEVVTENGADFLVYGEKKEKIRNHTVVVFNDSLAQLFLSKKQFYWEMTLYHSRDGVNFNVTMTPNYVNFDSARGTVDMELIEFLDYTSHQLFRLSSQGSQISINVGSGVTLYEARHPPYHVYQEYNHENLTERVQICPSPAPRICAWNLHGVLSFSNATLERVVARNDVGALDVTRRGELQLRSSALLESLNVYAEPRTVSIVNATHNLRFHFTNRTLQAAIGNDTFAVNSLGIPTVHCGANSKYTQKKVHIGQRQISLAELQRTIAEEGCENVDGGTNIVWGIPLGLGWQLQTATLYANLSLIGVMFSADSRFMLAKISTDSVEVRTKSIDALNRDYVKVDKNIFYVKTAAGYVHVEKGVVNFVSLLNRITVSPLIKIPPLPEYIPEYRNVLRAYDHRPYNSDKNIKVNPGIIYATKTSSTTSTTSSTNTFTVSSLNASTVMLANLALTTTTVSTTVSSGKTYRIPGKSQPRKKTLVGKEKPQITYANDISNSSVEMDANDCALNESSNGEKPVYCVRKKTSFKFNVTDVMKQAMLLLSKMKSTSSPATVTVTGAMNNGIIKDTNTTFAQYENTTTTTTITLPSTTTVGYGSERGSPPRHETATASDSSNRLVPLAHISIASVAREFRPESVEKEIFSQIAPNSASAEQRTTTKTTITTIIIATVLLWYLLLAVIWIV